MRMRVIVAAAATAVLIPALAACGSNGTSNAPTTAPSTAPTSAVTKGTYKVPVATQRGLANMVTLAHRIAAADAAAGKTLSQGLEGFWAPIETGVKTQSSTTYINIEDAMAGLESGDKAKATQAAADLESAINAFTGK